MARRGVPVRDGYIVRRWRGDGPGAVSWSAWRKALDVGKSIGMTAALSVDSPGAYITSPFRFKILALLPPSVALSVVPD